MLYKDVWLTSEMVDELCDLTGSHKRTVERWIQNKKIPQAVYQLMRMKYYGSIGEIHDKWSGWSIDRITGDLITPVDTSIRPGEILAIPYRLHLHTTLQREIRTLRFESPTHERPLSPIAVIQNSRNSPI